MPTGYTSVLFDKPETTFSEFASRCARAFGACMAMRDESLAVALPDEVKPETCSRDEVRKAEARVLELGSMNASQASAMAKAEHENVVRSNGERRARWERENATLTNMRAQVAAWAPPTNDHDELKAFMVDQLKISWPDLYEAPSVLLTGEEWLAKERLAAESKLKRCAEEWAEDVARAARATKWLQDLKRSLAEVR